MDKLRSMPECRRTDRQDRALGQEKLCKGTAQGAPQEYTFRALYHEVGSVRNPGLKASLQTLDWMRLMWTKTLLGWISTTVGPGESRPRKSRMRWFPAPENHARLSRRHERKNWSCGRWTRDGSLTLCKTSRGLYVEMPGSNPSGAARALPTPSALRLSNSPKDEVAPF